MNKILVLSILINSAAAAMLSRDAEIDKLSQIYRKIEDIRLNLSGRYKENTESEKLPKDIKEFTSKITELSSYYKTAGRKREASLLLSLELMKEEATQLSQDFAQLGHTRMLTQMPTKLLRLTSLVGEAHGMVHALQLNKSHISAKKLKLNSMRASL